jgi:hypothetical protein
MGMIPPHPDSTPRSRSQTFCHGVQIGFRRFGWAVIITAGGMGATRSTGKGSVNGIGIFSSRFPVPVEQERQMSPRAYGQLLGIYESKFN